MFVLLIFIYSYKMHRLEEAIHIDDDLELDSYDLPDADEDVKPV